MKLVRKFFLITSLVVVLASIAGLTDLTEITKKAEIERNLFNGLPGENNQILVVKIDDTKIAHPQIGIADADIVYVEQVESGLTRLAAIFSSKLPPLIGPVRSARISDIELLAQFGRVGFAYSGAQLKLRPVLAEANLENLSAERNPPSIYGKDLDRPGPVNMMLKPDLLLERANAKETTVIDKPTTAPWVFGDQQESLVKASEIAIKWPNSTYRLKWSVEQEKYLIYFGDLPNLDATGEHLYVDTAVIQLVSITPSIYGDKFGGVTPFTKTTGAGKAILLRDGFSHEISWERESEEDVTTWRRSDGEAANFKPGRIWVFLTDQMPKITP
ncbi:MAG: DUF3048 domain-containing protein [Candidatus Nanopelagicus sp.]